MRVSSIRDSGMERTKAIHRAKAVLEVRAYEVPILMEDDVVGRLHYYPMAATPLRTYGVSIGSSYQKQGLALSKQFRRADIQQNRRQPSEMPKLATA